MMTRDFLFRAWHPVERKMVYFDFTDIQRGEVLDAAFEGRYCDLSACQVMQYTGRQDCNGRAIYEGDILRFDSREWGSVEGVAFAIAWNAQLAQFDGNGAPSDWTEFCAVIGNVWEGAAMVRDAGASGAGG